MARDVADMPAIGGTGVAAPYAPSPVRLAPYIDPDELLVAAISLFAEIPGLPQKLLERAERDKSADKVFFFSTTSS